MRMGIYEIRNTIDGKVYIGSSNDITKRWTHHRWALRNERHHSRYLQRAYLKYGKSSFEFKILEIVEQETELLKREQHYLDKFRSYNKDMDYNICPIAGRNILSGEMHPRFGKKLSAEQKENMSVSLKEWLV